MSKRDFFVSAVTVDYGIWSLKLDAAGTAYTANRFLALDLNNADRTIALAGNLTLANSFTTVGNFATTLTTTAATTITLPTSGTLAVTGSNTFTGNQSINAAGSTTQGSLVFGGTTNNWIDFGTTGIGAPTFTTRSVGVKDVIYNALSASAVDYGFGIEANALWFATSATTTNFKWYGGTTLAATLTGTGGLTVVGSVTGSNLSGTNTGDQTTISGNAGTATALQTARLINGVSFNGTADITVAAAAGTLTGATLAPGVTGSSLTTVGTLVSLSATGDVAGGTLTIGTKKLFDLQNNNPEVGPINPLFAMVRGAGRAVYTDEEFALGTNSVQVYNNSAGAGIVLTREADATAPNNSGFRLKFVNDGVNPTSPGYGGFLQSITARANASFLQIFRAKLPAGYSFVIAENSQGTNNTSYWLTNVVGTGKWEDYIRVSHCGNTGTFSGGGHVYVNGSVAAFTWYVASCNVYDITNAPPAAIVGAGVVNTIALRDANGYLYGNFFNSTDDTATTAGAVGYFVIKNNTDNFYRSVTPTTARSAMGAAPTASPTFTGTLSAVIISASGAVTGSNLSGTNTGDQTTITGNAGTATALQTARLINGVSFNGTADITISAAAAASALTGTTLASNVVVSSLTSVGTLTGGTWNATVISPAYGGTGVNNGANTLSLAAPLTLSGAFPSTLVVTASTNVTLPTTGTLATTAGSETFLNKTIIGGSHQSMSTLSIRSSGTGPYDLTIRNIETLTSPRTLTFAVGAVDRTITLAGDVNFSGQFFVGGGSNVNIQTSGTNTSLTIPTGNNTVATLAGTETLTNKTITSPILTSPRIDGPITIPGTGVTSNNTTSTIVFRDPSTGGFAAGQVTLSSLIVSGVGSFAAFSGNNFALDLGTSGVGNAPMINFHSTGYASGTTYDARIQVTSTNATTSGQAGLTISAAAGVTFSGPISATTGAFSNTVTLTTTTINPFNSLVITNTGSNGAQILLTGNGATTPNKSIRLINGIMEVVNSAYTVATHRFLDNGDLQISGQITGAATLSGLTVTATTTTFSAATCGLEIGAQGTANAPYIDFHSSSTSNDFDVRLQALSSTGVSSGLGVLGITATSTTHTGNGTFNTYATIGQGAATTFYADGSNTAIRATVNGGAVYFQDSVNTNAYISTSGLVITTPSSTTSPQVFLNSATMNWVSWANVGVGAPTFTTRSTGAKLVLYSSLGASAGDYAFGIENSTLWSSVPTSAQFFKWYAGTTLVGQLTGTGAFTAADGATINSVSNTTTLALTNTASNGVQIKMTGNGATTPSKTLRVYSGILDIVNDAYTASILVLSDAGNMTLGGTLTLPGTIYCSALDGIRFRSGNATPTAFFRNDGSNFYILLTDAATPDGTFNAFRPFSINVTTGNTYISNLYISGSLSTSGNNNSSGYTYASTAVYADQSIFPRATPANYWGIDFTQGSGGTNSGYISFAAGATYDLAVGSGLVVLHDNEAGQMGFYMCYAGVVAAIAGGSAVYVSGVPGANQIGLYYNAGTNKYRINNGTGAARSIWITTIRTRPSS
jgi:hypothetical protein